MDAFNRLCQLAEDFSPVSDFLTVYIEEAHPIDGWAISSIRLTSHKNIQERIAAARMLEGESSGGGGGGRMRLIVDNMLDECNSTYGSFPERLFIIQDGVVVYEGGRGPEYFNVDEIEEWLTGYRQTSVDR